MPATDPTVFVIDDDEDIRSSLSRSLGKRGFQVATFASAAAFLEVHDPEQSGCIVLDQGMPGMTGLELQARLVASGHAIPIIFVTGHGGVRESVQAMKAGAIDFLEKPFRADELVDRINAAFEVDATNGAMRNKSQDARAKLDALTAREKEIVDLIVANPSSTSSKDIARALNISPRTVDHHRARILEKMQLRSIVELVDLCMIARLDQTDPRQISA